MNIKKIYQSFIFIILIFLVPCKAFAISCNLKADKLSDNGYGTLELSLYNPNSTTVSINAIEYYKSGSLLRSYKVFHQIRSKTSKNFSHTTNSNFLSQVETVDVDCYIYKVNKKQNLNKLLEEDKGWWRWWYLLIIPLSVWIYDSGVFNQNKPKSNKNKKVSETKISEGKKSGDFLSDLIEGRKSLAETYWLYFVLINAGISLGCGYLFEKNDSYFYFIPTLISNLLTSVAVWNSSTFFQLKKIKEKKPYGWATAAKGSVVLNALFIVVQAIVLLNL